MSFSLFRRLFPNEHEWAESNLSAYMDDELDKQDRVRVERHLQSCAACREELASLRQTANLLALVPELALPRSFLVPVQAAQPVSRGMPAFGVLRTASAMATFLFAVVLSGNLLLRAGYGANLVPMMGQTDSASEIAVMAEKEAAAPEMMALDTAEAEGEVMEKAAPAVMAVPEKAAANGEQMATVPAAEGVSMLTVVEPSPEADGLAVGAGGTPMFSKVPQITAKKVPAQEQEASVESAEVVVEREAPKSAETQPATPLPEPQRIVVEKQGAPPTEPARVAVVEKTQAQPAVVELPSQPSQRASSRTRLQAVLDGLLWALLLSTVGLWAVTAMLSKRHR